MKTRTSLVCVAALRLRPDLKDAFKLGERVKIHVGKGRVLIWEGATELIGWHDPLQRPGEDGGPQNAP